MRICTRCRCEKPDASYVTPNKETHHPERERLLGMCLHCRTIGIYASTPPAPKARMAPTVEGAKAISLARRERAAFIARGAPEIPRPYVHTDNGIPVRHKPTLKRGLTLLT